jgi:hypothetical protein
MSPLKVHVLGHKDGPRVIDPCVTKLTPGTDGFVQEVERLIEHDVSDSLTDLLGYRRDISKKWFPDYLLYRLWERVCRGESSVEPMDVIAAGLKEMGEKAELARIYFLCSPECILEPTREVISALFDVDDRAFLAKASWEMDSRECVVRALMQHIELFTGCGRVNRVFIPLALRRCPDLLEDTELLRRISNAFGTSPEEMITGMSKSLWLIPGRAFGGKSIQGFELYPVFKRFIDANPPHDMLWLGPSDLFESCLLHMAVTNGWLLSSTTMDGIQEPVTLIYESWTLNLPNSKPELILAKASLRVLLNLPAIEEQSVDVMDIGIDHPNWYRARFLQECLVRVGLADDRLYAVDSPLVAQWIVSNGDAIAAMERFKEARGNLFKLDEVHPSILEKIDNTKRRKII